MTVLLTASSLNEWKSLRHIAVVFTSIELTPRKIANDFDINLSEFLISIYSDNNMEINSFIENQSPAGVYSKSIK